MKKMITLMMALSILNFSMAAVPFTDGGGGNTMNATQIRVPLGKTGQTISLMELSTLKPSEYAKMAHVKMDFLIKFFIKCPCIS